MIEIPEHIINQNKKFIEEIHKNAEDNGGNYIDAIVSYCDKYDVEIEAVASLILEDSNLKSCVEKSAEDLNFLPKKARLIFD